MTSSSHNPHLVPPPSIIPSRSCSVEFRYPVIASVPGSSGIIPTTVYTRLDYAHIKPSGIGYDAGSSQVLRPSFGQGIINSAWSPIGDGNTETVFVANEACRTA